ncbi:hypothetical protein C5S31_08465 [ANME-1 cluster archaeon GoMg2]|nr:hypothetical protein [ANME-1 cluster archaeon GoMg2]
MLTKRVEVSITIFLMIALMTIPFTSAQYPKEVLDAKESVVYIFTWVDGTIEIYFNETGWVTEPIAFPFSSATGFLLNDDGYVMTAAHAIEHDEVDLQLAAVDTYIVYDWLEWGYEEYSLDEFFEIYYEIVIEKLEKGEFYVYADAVNYVYWYKEDEPHRVQQVIYKGDPKSGLDIAILKIEVSDVPSLTFKDVEVKEGMNIYAIGYPGVDVDTEFVNAVERIILDPMLRPDTFQELISMAGDEMLKKIRYQGASVHGGELGTSTTMGAMTVYRFHGYSGHGLSGGPIIDEEGYCTGMMAFASDKERGFFIPFKYLEQAANHAGVDISTHKTIWEGIVEHRLHILYAVIVGIAIAAIEHVIKRRRRK